MNTELNDNPEGYIPLTHIRPRFHIETEDSAEELCNRLKEGFLSAKGRCVGEAHHRYASLRIPQDQLHYWSPQLTLTFEESEGKCMVRGLIGPRPAVWTMLMFFYAVIGFAIIVIGVIGMSLLTMGDEAHVLWWIPLLLLTFMSIYAIAYLGKKKSHDQMITLVRFFEESTGLRI